MADNETNSLVRLNSLAQFQMFGIYSVSEKIIMCYGEL
jgi:hypothetical protein